MSLPAISVSGLSCALGGKTVLDNVSFEVHEGTFLSIVGPNGAGKTSLLKCLNRILSPSAGRILLWGRDVVAYTRLELAVELGYVPQGGTEGAAFTVYEFAMLGRYPHLSAFTSPSARDEAKVREALQLADAVSLADRMCGALSGGERQRVLIAAALAQDARILLLDEPTTFLDPHHEQDVLQLLARLNRQSGVTILCVTHDLNAASLFSSQILALKRGRTQFQGGSDEFMREKNLCDLFGRSFTLVDHPCGAGRIIVPEIISEKQGQG